MIDKCSHVCGCDHNELVFPSEKCSKLPLGEDILEFGALCLSLHQDQPVTHVHR